MSEDDKLLTVREVSDLCTVSERKIWRDVAAGLFPKPLKLGPKPPDGGDLSSSSSSNNPKL